jgi:hypothetical protein
MIEFISPKSREVSRVFIHCSASSVPEHGNVNVIRKWHLDRGWNDIGYHYFIPFSGELQLGRDIEIDPAAQKGHNENTIAICVHGLKINDFTVNQFNTLIKLCSIINGECDGVTFHGHCEVSNKSCPVFDYKSLLDLQDNGVIISGQLQKADNLKLFDTGMEVIKLQMQLNTFLMIKYQTPNEARLDLNYILRKKDSYITVDGIFGQQTQMMLILFQNEAGLTVDGVAGPRTRLKLPISQDIS